MKHLQFPLWTAILFELLVVGCKKDEGTSNPQPEAPIAAFSVDKMVAKVGEAITFTNESQNATSYEWVFGDGSKSFEDNPIHSYSSAGTYTVELIARNLAESSIAKKTISVMDLPPVADFVMSKTVVDLGEVVTFTNNSQNASSYFWDFGDGVTSTLSNPTHSYGEVGDYIVKLTASNNGLIDSIEKNIKVVIPVNIFPGDRIRGLSLGEIWGSVKNMPGYDFTEYGPILVGSTILHPVEEKSMGITFYLLGSGLIKADSDPIALISVKNPFIGVTEKGIGLGSTTVQVKSAYGLPNEISNGFYRYTSLGIDFKITSSEVSGIIIYIP